MGEKQDVATIFVRVIGIGPNAIKINDGDRDLFLPRSQVVNMSELEKGKTQDVLIPEWLARKEGLI